MRIQEVDGPNRRPAVQVLARSNDLAGHLQGVHFFFQHFANAAPNASYVRDDPEIRRFPGTADGPREKTATRVGETQRPMRKVKPLGFSRKMRSSRKKPRAAV